MATRPARLTRGLLAAFCLGFAAPLPAAHALPLFRHALEQSAPAPYEVLLFHRGELSPDAQARSTALEDARSRSQANANFRLIDLEEPVDPAAASLWRAQETAQAEPPWLVVRAPHPASNAPAVWAGPLDAPWVEHLFESPARTRIAEGLLRGATAMWILLECGEAVRDETAVDRLTSSLRALEKQLKPPSRRGSQSPLPLRIDFGLVRVTRSDLAEEFLVQLLEHGAPAVDSRPLAFAVFGRGRLVGPLSGRDLDLEGIRDVCQKLVAPPAPGQSRPPGRDLLLGADWRRVWQPAPTPSSPGSPGPSAPASPGTGNGSGPRPSWMQLAAGAVLLTAAGAALRARRRRRH